MISQENQIKIEYDVRLTAVGERKRANQISGIDYGIVYEVDDSTLKDL